MGRRMGRRIENGEGRTRREMGSRMPRDTIEITISISISITISNTAQRFRLNLPCSCSALPSNIATSLPSSIGISIRDTRHFNRRRRKQELFRGDLPMAERNVPVEIRGPIEITQITATAQITATTASAVENPLSRHFFSTTDKQSLIDLILDLILTHIQKCSIVILIVILLLITQD